MMPGQPTQHDDHDARIAVLEVEAGHFKESLSDNKMWLTSIDGKVDSIKERLDKQNGTIPHTLDAVKSLASTVDVLSHKVEKIHDAAAEGKIKTNLIWGLFTAVLIAVVEIILHKFGIFQ